MNITTAARRTSSDVAALLSEFDASGQTAAAFARTRGLEPWRVYNALKRRKSIAQRAAARLNSARPALLPVRVVPDTVAARASPPACLVLELAGGHRLRIGSDFDADLLRRVLGALGRC